MFLDSLKMTILGFLNSQKRVKFSSLDVTHKLITQNTIRSTAYIKISNQIKSKIVKSVEDAKKIISSPVCLKLLKGGLRKRSPYKTMRSPTERLADFPWLRPSLQAEVYLSILQVVELI